MEDWDLKKVNSGRQYNNFLKFKNSSYVLKEDLFIEMLPSILIDICKKKKPQPSQKPTKQTEAYA